MTAQTAQAKKALFLVEFAKRGNITRAAKAAEVPRRTVYEWLKRDAVFAVAYADAEQAGIDALEEEAHRRAIDGSDTLLIFLLKAARPSKYRERVDITYDIKHAVERLTADPEERVAAMAEVERILAEAKT